MSQNHRLNMDIEIKSLLEVEWEKHKDLRLEALKNEPLVFGSSYDESNLMSEENWRTRTHDNVLFAMLNGTPKGMLAIIFNTRMKTRHIAEIHGMYLAKDVRGLEIGSKLMNAALRKIK